MKKRWGACVTPRKFLCTSEYKYCSQCAIGGQTVFVCIEAIFRFVQHMDSVHAKLVSLGLENESAEDILKRYAEIGLPNWCCFCCGTGLLPRGCIRVCNMISGS